MSARRTGIQIWTVPDDGEYQITGLVYINIIFRLKNHVFRDAFRISFFVSLTFETRLEKHVSKPNDL